MLWSNFCLQTCYNKNVSQVHRCPIHTFIFYVQCSVFDKKLKQTNERTDAQTRKHDAHKMGIKKYKRKTKYFPGKFHICYLVFLVSYDIYRLSLIISTRLIFSAWASTAKVKKSIELRWPMIICLSLFYLWQLQFH